MRSHNLIDYRGSVLLLLDYHRMVESLDRNFSIDFPRVMHNHNVHCPFVSVFVQTQRRAVDRLIFLRGFVTEKEKR